MKNKNKSGAFFVGLGILLSRIFGLVRERVFAHYFGNSDAGDAFKAALKIPNFLQNLFGEGALSASFIPVYSQLVEKDKTQADQLAKTIFAFLALAVSVLVLLGVLFTASLIDLIAPGFSGEKKELTIELVRIFFPGIGLLVLSAWCLGILNSHRKFFIPYAAPVIWNVAIIGSLLWGGRFQSQSDLAVTAAWGLVLGSFLQFFIQLPTTLKLVPLLRTNLQHKATSVKTVIKNFGPAVVSRGIVQISAYIDNVLASWLPTGAVSALAYAQTIYLLPIGLFGMSISASELPELSRTQVTSSDNQEDANRKLQERLESGLEKVSFYIIPTVVAFFVFGDLIVKTLFKTGQFDEEASQLVWKVLMGSTVGLLATTLGRLYSSSFYALQDTRTPLKFSLIRILSTTLLGVLFAFYLPKALNISPLWGTAGLTSSAGISGWIEYMMLKQALQKKIGLKIRERHIQKLWISAIFAGICVFLIKKILVLGAVSILLALHAGVFGILYMLIASFFHIPSAEVFMKKIKQHL
ncbi:MAG: murein biosynthesis integral membrane protein MurJ [Deltaproteobacteria bacterium]|nr:MAG: murein biosynthesis integral membrane protein MurJ [Deltaproteobacteria bacterium]